MALEHFDGFDDYNTAQLNRYWNSIGTPTITTTSGRNGTGSLHAANNNNAFVMRQFASVATRTIGFAIKYSTAGSGGPQAICCFNDSTAASPTQQVTILVTGGGAIQARRGNAGGVVLGTASSGFLFSNVWAFVEVTVTISATVGVVTVNVNGVQVLNLTAQNTKNTANTTSDSIILMSDALSSSNSAICSTAIVDVDDFYSRNDATMMGDCRVETVLATGAGATTQWTPLSGANYTNVNRNPATDDTNYNSDGTAGDIDLYTYPAIPTATGTVQAVMTAPVMRNDSAGTITAQSVYRSGGTNYFGGTQSIASTTYTSYPDIQVNDPNTSSPWTITNVNACQFGIKRVT